MQKRIASLKNGSSLNYTLWNTESAAFCTRCGTTLADGYRPVSTRLDAMASSLANGSFGFAKVLMWIFGGGMAFVFGCTALELFLTAGYLFYHFAKGISVVVPLFITEALSITTISGVWLFVSGIASALIAILLSLAVRGIVKSIASLNNRGKEAAGNG